MQGGLERGSRPSVLVVDDHELFRSGLASVLRGELGFSNVIQAENLATAVTELERGQDIELATFDLAMLGVDGAASLNALRRRFPKVLLVVLSASSGRRDILAAMAAGVHGYIPKTFGIRQIAGALRRVLDGEVYVPPDLARVETCLDTGNGSPPASERQPDDLTPRQRAVLNAIAEGKSNKQIARALGLTESTVKVHVHALFRALDVHNRTSAAAALRQSESAANPARHPEPAPGRLPEPGEPPATGH